MVALPAYGLLELGFLAILLCFLALDPLWRHTVGAALVRMSKIGFGGVHGVGAVHPLAFLADVNAAVETRIENGKAWAERGVSYTFTLLSEIASQYVHDTQAVARALQDLAAWSIHSVGHAVTRVEHSTVVKKVTTVTKTAAQVTAKQFTHLQARVKSLEHKIAHATHVAAGAIAAPFPRIGRLEKTAKAQGKRITKLEKLLAGGLGVALLVRALTKLGLNYIKCDRNKQLGKGICKTDPSWVTEFLAGAVLLAGLNSFHEFVEEAQAGFDLGLEGLQLFIKEFQDLPIPKS